MSSRIHGTKDVPERSHPVFDLRYWESQFPLDPDPRKVKWPWSSPGRLALREQEIRRVRQAGDLGVAVPADVFAWALMPVVEKPWLTRIGGVPWRPQNKPWPRDRNGVPLLFLGQICFADSSDILPFELPGEVALIFGTGHGGWFSVHKDWALEWSPMKIDEPQEIWRCPWNGLLTLNYQGVIHRTVLHPDRHTVDAVLESMGYEPCSSGGANMETTLIATTADFQQGPPFEEGDGNTLIAMLSSLYFRGEWPVCDVPACLRMMSGAPGKEVGVDWSPLNFGIGDNGCIYIYRDKNGEYLLGMDY